MYIIFRRKIIRRVVFVYTAAHSNMKETREPTHLSSLVKSKSVYTYIHVIIHIHIFFLIYYSTAAVKNAAYIHYCVIRKC